MNLITKREKYLGSQVASETIQDVAVSWIMMTGWIVATSWILLDLITSLTQML